MAYYNLITDEIEERAHEMWLALLYEEKELVNEKCKTIYKNGKPIGIRFNYNIKKLIKNVLISKINSE